MESKTSSERYNHLIQLLEREEPVIIPTSTLPALAVRPTKKGLDTIYKIKNRKHTQPVGLLVNDLNAVSNIVSFNKKILKLLNSFKKGSLTIVLPCNDTKMDARLGDDWIGIRVVNNPIAQKIVDAIGPITSTSANKSGEETIFDCVKAAEYLGMPISSAWPALTKGGKPSTVIKVEFQQKNRIEKLTLIREGVVAWSELEHWLMKES